MCSLMLHRRAAVDSSTRELGLRGHESLSKKVASARLLLWEGRAMSRMLLVSVRFASSAACAHVGREWREAGELLLELKRIGQSWAQHRVQQTECSAMRRLRPRRRRRRRS